MNTAPQQVKRVYESIDPITGERNTPGENMNHPGEFYIIEKRGYTKDEFVALMEKLNAKHSKKWYHKIFGIDPKRSMKYLKEHSRITKKRYIWPSVKTIAINCPYCGVPFASTDGTNNTELHIVEEIGDTITVEQKLVCPHAKSHSFTIKSNNIFLVEESTK